MPRPLWRGAFTRRLGSVQETLALRQEELLRPFDLLPHANLDHLLNLPDLYPEDLCQDLLGLLELQDLGVHLDEA